MQTTSKIFFTGVLFTLLGCSSYVAPTLDGNAVSTDAGSQAENAVTIETGEASGETPGGSDPSADGNPDSESPNESPSDDITTAAEELEESVDEGEILGSIEVEESTDFEFAGKSVYAVWMDTGSFRSLSITISDTEVRDTSFREVSEYECRDCAGDDDPRCNTEAGESPNSIVMTFTPPFFENPDHQVDANAYPLQDEMILTGDAATDGNVGMSLFNSQDAAALGHAGGITFTQRPADVGEEFAGVVDITWGNGSTYKSTISGMVLQSPEYPTAPECDVGNGQYLYPIYAE